MCERSGRGMGWFRICSQLVVNKWLWLTGCLPNKIIISVLMCLFRSTLSRLALYKIPLKCAG